MVDSETRCIEPENLVLIDLINRFQPERVASIHGSTSTDPAKMVKEGGASVTTDPRPGHEAEDDALALTMAQEAKKSGVRVPSNFLGDPKQRTRYPTSTAAHDPGVTLGMWGSHDAPVQSGSTAMRPAMNLILVETFGNKTSADGSAAEKAKRGTELMNMAQVLQNFFLVAPPAVANPGGSTGGTAAPPVVQPKLTVNQPGDIYEQEADNVAEQVMRMPEGSAPAISRLDAASGDLHRKCAHCEDEEKAEHVYRKESGGGVPPAFANVQQTVAAPGQALDPSTKQFMEQRFGHDFGRVRVHAGPADAASARALSAQAYTVGSDIVFSDGKYSPASSEGRRLLAHELTHVVQQGGEATAR